MPPWLTLSIIGYELRVSEEIQGKEWRPSLYFSFVAIEKEVFGSLSTTVDQLT